MGCSGGKTSMDDDHLVVPQMRRRLSIGDVDNATEEAWKEVNEEDRSMITNLTESETLDFIKLDRKFSICSETDKQMQHVTSFTGKTTKRSGDSIDLHTECIGFACKKGLKPEAPNQDSFVILKVMGLYSLYGVFDGHGKKGHDISNFVKENLPKILISQNNIMTDPVAALKTTFERTQYLIEKATSMKKIDALSSGTTCSIVMHHHEDNMLYVAHVGDSRVVLAKTMNMENHKRKYEALDLTVDHKPDLPEERARIERAGGIVLFDGGWNYRVYAKGKDHRGKRFPGLNMSRAMGDLNGFYKAGLSAVPDVNKRVISVHSPDKFTDKFDGDDSIDQERVQQPTTAQPAHATLPNTTVSSSEGGNTPKTGRRPSMESKGSAVSSAPSVSSYSIDPVSDQFLLLCSDGVWEFISSEEAVQLVGKNAPTDSMQAAEQLAAHSWERWMKELNGQVVDDITALVVYLVR